MVLTTLTVEHQQHHFRLGMMHVKACPSSSILCTLQGSARLCRAACLVSAVFYLRSGASWQVQLHGLLDRVRLVMVPKSRPLGSDFSLLLSRCSDLMAVTPANVPSESWTGGEVGVTEAPLRGGIDRGKCN